MVFLIGLGIIDLLAAILLLLFHFSLIPGRVAFIAAIYLIGKGVAFPKDIASMIDFIVGVYMLGMIIFGFKTLFVYVLIAWLLQKALLSMISR
jgi:hypothetical protein